MQYKITLIPGDGIGPEVTTSAVSCIEAVAEKYNFTINWDEQYIGEVAKRKFGSLMPENTLRSIKKNRFALKGPTATESGKGFRSMNVELRQRLDLYANLRPARLFKGIESCYSKVDLVVVRENTEDLYAGIEFEEGKKDTLQLIDFVKSRTGKSIRRDSGITIKPISAFASKRIVKFAFDYAKDMKRKRVTAVHKANIMKFSDGLFLSTAEKVAKGYPSIAFDNMIVDNLCMQLIRKPDTFDILVCPNLYGDIMSDLCAGLVGGLGLAPSANIGDNCAVFEPVHGSAPKHAGKNDVNPSATILSAVLMLQRMGEHKAATELEHALLKVISERKVVTYDLSPKKPAKTTAMTKEIIRKIRG
ncbi:MAG: isocitrate/isopropylmalate dehydrogenase family protein [Candidatus Micrarchaeales archaeon]